MLKSRLDLLWDKFGGVTIAPSNDSTTLLTEETVKKLISEVPIGVRRLEYREHPISEDKMQLIGYDDKDYPITTVDIDKNINDVRYRTVTLEDIDNGIEAELGVPALELVYEGKAKLVPLTKTNLKGSTTNTISTEIVSNAIKSDLVVDSGNNAISSVKLKTSNNGIYNKLNVDNSLSIELKETKYGLSAVLHLLDSDIELKFAEITWEEYNALEDKNTNTIYFITNKPLIYFNGRLYSDDVDLKISELNTSILEKIDAIRSLKSAVLEGDELVLTYSTTSGDSEIRINLSKYIDLYTAGKNITIKDNVISADVPVKSVGITQSGANEVYLALNDLSEAVPFPMAKLNSNGNYQCGLMSKEDKEHLDNLPANLDEYAKKANYKVREISIRKSESDVSILINNTDELPLPIARKYNEVYETGLMSQQDKEKLDIIDTDKLVTIDNIDDIVTNYDDTEVKLRISNLEAIDHSLYLTEHLDISNLATKEEVTTAIQNIVGAAPEALDTLEEIAAKLTEDSDAVAAINEVLTGKVNKADALHSIDTRTSDVETTPDEIVFNTADGIEYSNKINVMKINGKTVASTSSNVECINVPTKEEFDTLEGNVYTKTESDGKYLTEHLDISGKVDTVEGKGLSTNDFTDEEKAKLAGLLGNVVALTQDEFDVITDKDNGTLYIVD